MPMNRGAFPVTTVRAGLKKVYFNEYMQHRELYTSIFNMETSNRGFEDFVKVSGLGRMAQLGENESIFYDRAVEGTRISAGHTMFGLGFQISRVLWDDEQKLTQPYCSPRVIEGWLPSPGSAASCGKEILN